ncbi:MAG: hypothetical protein MO853_11895 [Candidatus Protistobacter heckmanni]|nr:hypothetical protein [Candidatus Protistobacter heckmanni]
MENEFGFQARNDELNPVAIYLTENGQPYALNRSDTVNLLSTGLYGRNTTFWAT